MDIFRQEFPEIHEEMFPQYYMIFSACLINLIKSHTIVAKGLIDEHHQDRIHLMTSNHLHDVIYHCFVENIKL